jgi:hypothetical protein
LPEINPGASIFCDSKEWGKEHRRGRHLYAGR